MNNTTNSSSNGPSARTRYECLFDSYYIITFSVSMTLTSLLALFGNVLILVAMCKYSRRFQGSLYLKIRNLAVSDLLLGFTSLLFPVEFLWPQLQKSLLFCMTRFTLTLTSITVSGFTTMLISLDRLMAVVFPMRHLVVSKKKTMFFILFAATWFICLGTSTAVLATNYQKRPDGSFVCRHGLLADPNYAIIPSSLVLAQFLFNIILYTVVICFLQRTRFNDNSRGPNRAKTIAMIVTFAIHAICWFPFIMTSILILVREDQKETLVCVLEYTAILGAIDGGLNWIIYALYYEKFRAVFKELLAWKPRIDDVRNSFSNVQSSIGAK